MATHLPCVTARWCDSRTRSPAPGGRDRRPDSGRRLPAPVSRRRVTFSVTSSSSSSSASSSSSPSNAADGAPPMTITTFNVLAPCYKRFYQPDGTVVMESQDMATALDRQTRVLDFLANTSSDVLCLQEFWHANDATRLLYETRLRDAGYALHVTKRTGNRPDGLLTAVRKKSFLVVEAKDVLFNDCGDRVATLLHLRRRVVGDGDDVINISANDTSQGSVVPSHEDLLVVNTHLLFPHNANSTLIRLRESFKILEYLHAYQTSATRAVVDNGGSSRRLPVVMCGDFNGTSRGSVARFLTSQGFVSAFEACRGGCGNDTSETQRIESEAQVSVSSDETCELDTTQHWISHLNHHGKVVGVDHIFVLNPTRQINAVDATVPGPSWKTAIYAMIQAKMLEKGLQSNKKAFAFFDVDDTSGITVEEFRVAVAMLDLTGEGSPGLIQSEIDLLYEDCDKDGDGRVDFSEFIRKLDVETMESAYKAIRASQDIEEGPWDVVGDLMATAASPAVLAGFTVDDDDFFLDFTKGPAKGDLAVKNATLPEPMQRGVWPSPAEFDLSDHGPLTAVLVART